MQQVEAFIDTRCHIYIFESRAGEGEERFKEMHRADCRDAPQDYNTGGQVPGLTGPRSVLQLHITHKPTGSYIEYKVANMGGATRFVS